MDKEYVIAEISKKDIIRSLKMMGIALLFSVGFTGVILILTFISMKYE